MNLADLSLMDLAGTFLGFVLTLMTFSYIFGDNALFRIAIHIFIGVSAGYAAIIAWYSVILPQLVTPIISGTRDERILVVLPLVLSALLLFKVSKRFSTIGNVSIAYLVGIGMATAIGGTIVGTIFPQVEASINLFDFEGVNVGESLLKFGTASIMLIGTLATLVYFHFGVKSDKTWSKSVQNWIQLGAWIGLVFIAITFGSVFAGVYSSALTAFIERVSSISDFVLSMIFGP